MTSEEKIVLEVHNTFWQGLAMRDLDSRFSVVSPDVTFFGTGQYERAVGIEKYRQMNQEGINQYPYQYEIEFLWHDIRIFGEIAWIECDTVWIKNVEDKIIKDNIRITTIFKKENGKWWVIHVHGSNPDYRLKEGEHTIDANILKRNRELERQVFERTQELETEKREVEKQKEKEIEKKKEEEKKEAAIQTTIQTTVQETVSSTLKNVKKQKKAKRDKLKNLEKKYGTITLERYTEALKKITSTTVSPQTEAEINHEKNIADLYTMQNRHLSEKTLDVEQELSDRDEDISDIESK